MKNIIYESIYYLIFLIVLINSFEIKYTNSDMDYIYKVNTLCPLELKNNYAGKQGLYFNTTNEDIKKSIVKKYFHHCGAWCLFDYRDPRNGWYWNSIHKDWMFYKNLYLICPDNEFHYVLNKFFIDLKI